ncbi:MAG: hypothetical protein EBU84_12620 [Actinobacteria bacterium]|nr:hypothetical protein [Actinomycetota bacterium]
MLDRMTWKQMDMWAGGWETHVELDEDIPQYVPSSAIYTSDGRVWMGTRVVGRWYVLLEYPTRSAHSGLNQIKNLTLKVKPSRIENIQYLQGWTTRVRDHLEKWLKQRYLRLCARVMEETQGKTIACEVNTMSKDGMKWLRIYEIQPDGAGVHVHGKMMSCGSSAMEMIAYESVIDTMTQYTFQARKLQNSADRLNWQTRVLQTVEYALMSVLKRHLPKPQDDSRCTARVQVGGVQYYFACGDMRWKTGAGVSGSTDGWELINVVSEQKENHYELSIVDGKILAES